MFFAAQVVFAAVGYGQVGKTLDSDAAEDLEEITIDDFPSESRDRISDDLAASEAKELALSDAELRARHGNGAGVFLGEVIPWATAGVEVHYLKSPFRAYTLSGGAGSFDQFGKRTDLRSVDITSSTRAIGFGMRWYHANMPQVSLQATTTYVVWKGKASPHGADADDSNAALESLSSGFDATSASLGIGIGVSKVWTNGCYFDWLPVGLKKSVLLKKKFSRPDNEVKSAVTKFIERQEVFGFINVRFGFFF
jgi:hypothetical protein